MFRKMKMTDAHGICAEMHSEDVPFLLVRDLFNENLNFNKKTHLNSGSFSMIGYSVPTEDQYIPGRCSGAEPYFARQVFL